MAEDLISKIVTDEALSQLREMARLVKDSSLDIVTLNRILRNAEGATMASKSIRELNRNISTLTTDSHKLQQAKERLAKAASEEAKQIAILNAQTAEQNRLNKESARNAIGLTDAYKKLENQHKALEREAKNIGVLFGKNSKEFQTAAAAANEVRTRLIGIKQSLGDFRDNVGNYASGFSGVGQILREIPNAAISTETFLISISNNLSQVGDDIARMREQNALAVAQGKASVPVWRQLASALFNWQTAIVLGATALVVWGKELTKGSKAAQDAEKANKKYQDRLASIEQTSKENAIAEVARLKLYNSIATDENETRKKRLQAVQKMQDLYPSVLNNYSQEAILAGKAAGEIEKLTQSILQKAVAEASSEKYAAAFIKETELRDALTASAQELAEAEQKLIDLRAQADNTDLVDPQTTGAYATAIRQQESVVARTAREYDNIRKALVPAIDETKKYADAAERAVKAVDDLLVKPKKTPKGKATPDLTDEKISVEQRKLAAELELAREELENKRATNEAIAEDDTRSLNDRLTAYSVYQKARIDLVNLEKEQEVGTIQVKLDAIKKLEESGRKTYTKEQQDLLNEKAALNAEKLAIDAKYARAYGDINVQAAKFVSSAIKNAARQENDTRMAEFEEIRSAQLVFYEKDLSDLNAQLDQKKISYDKWVEKRIQAELKYQRAVLEAQRAFAEKEIKDLQAAGGDTSDLIAKLNRITEALAKLNKDEKASARDEELKTLHKITTTLEGYLSVQTAIADLVSSINQQRLAAYDEEIKAIEERGEAEIKSIERSALTEEEKQKRIQASEKVTEAQRQQLERFKRADAQRFARAEKAFLVGEIIARTALAVITAFTEGDPYTKAVRAIAAGAVGTVQLAKAIATPIPQYAEGAGIKGRPRHKGGLAVVGEGEQPELVDEGGKMWWATSPTLKNLKAGTRVIPEDQLLRNGYNVVPKMPTVRAFQQPKRDDRLLHTMERVERQLMKQKRPLVKIHIDSYQQFRDYHIKHKRA